MGRSPGDVDMANTAGTVAFAVIRWDHFVQQKIIIDLDEIGVQIAAPVGRQITRTVRESPHPGTSCKRRMEELGYTTRAPVRDERTEVFLFDISLSYDGTVGRSMSLSLAARAGGIIY